MARLDLCLADRIALAKRVANRCSFPGCTAVTSGPSSEGPSAVTNSGTACHIISASQGPAARRNIAGTAPDDIKHISNGIWMCATHGRIIDNDEVTFNVDMLRTWRKIAEFCVQYEQQHGKRLSIETVKLGIPVVEDILTVSTATGINQAVGELLIHCCVPQIWGSAANDAVRDLIIEIVLNAFEHGGSTTVTISIFPQCISLSFDGPLFDPFTSLVQSIGGGGNAIRHLLDEYGDKILTTYQYDGEVNRVVIAVPDSPADVLNATQCAMRLDNNDTEEKKNLDFIRTAGCSVIYVVLPQFFGWSDARKMKDILRQHIPPDKRVVFVAEDISVGVAARITEEIEGAKVIRLRGL